MSEQIKIGSWNTGGVFVNPENEAEQKFIEQQLDEQGSDLLFLAEAGHDQIGEELSSTLDSLGYTAIAQARHIDRRDDVHAMKGGVDIMNVMAWRDTVAGNEVSTINLGVRTGFRVDLDEIPAVFTHFDDWTKKSRHVMAQDLLFDTNVNGGPLVIAADMNAADKRVNTVAQRVLSSAPYQFVSERIADLPLPEKAHRPVNIVRRLGEIAGDNLLEYFANHGLHTVLPPEPTFDARHAGDWGRRVQLGVDNILTREHEYYQVMNGQVGDLAQQPGQLDHAPVSAVIEL